jgi:hypothetical protein
MTILPSTYEKWPFNNIYLLTYVGIYFYNHPVVLNKPSGSLSNRSFPRKVAGHDTLVFTDI